MRKRKLRVGDYVYYCGEKCYVYQADNQHDIGLERCCDGISWDGIEADNCTLCSKHSRLCEPFS